MQQLYLAVGLAAGVAFFVALALAYLYPRRVAAQVVGVVLATPIVLYLVMLLLFGPPEEGLASGIATVVMLVFIWAPIGLITTGISHLLTRNAPSRAARNNEISGADR